MDASIIDLPITQELQATLKTTALRVADFVKDGAIQTEAHFERACMLVRDEKQSLKTIKDKLDPLVKKANDTHKGLTSMRSEMMAPHQRNLDMLDGLMDDWGQRQQAAIDAARREEARLAQEARDAARMAAEAAEQAEREAAQAAETLRLMEQAEAQGDTETADALSLVAAEEQDASENSAGLAEAMTVVAQQAQTERRAVEAPATKFGGVGLRENWKAEIIDPALIPRTVNIGGGEVELMIPNMVEINKLAKMLKDKMAIPGIKAVRVFGTSTRL